MELVINIYDDSDLFKIFEPYLGKFPTSDIRYDIMCKIKNRLYINYKFHDITSELDTDTYTMKFVMQCGNIKQVLILKYMSNTVCEN